MYMIAVICNVNKQLCAAAVQTTIGYTYRASSQSCNQYCAAAAALRVTSAPLTALKLLQCITRSHLKVTTVPLRLDIADLTALARHHLPFCLTPPLNPSR